jgi:hypothetical protein
MVRPFAAPAVRFCAGGAPEPGEATADLPAVFWCVTQKKKKQQK